jgi:hypothetical protein
VPLYDGATGLPLVRLSLKVKTVPVNGKFLGGLLARLMEPPGTFSPDSRLLLARRLRTVRVWELASGKLLGEFPGDVPPADEQPQVDEKAMLYLRTSSSKPFDHSRLAPKSVVNPIQHALFAADGRSVLVGWQNGRAILYDLLTGKERRRWDLPPGHQFSALSADGRWLVTGHQDTQVLVWDTKTTAPRSKQADPLTNTELEQLWGDLATEVPAQAYRAIARLAVSPRAVVFLKERLRPQATAEEERIARLVRDLDAPKFAVRQSAGRELKAIGWPALRALLVELQRDLSLESRRRIELVVETIPARDGAADRLVPAGEALRSYRAIQVLERAGTAEARRVLVRLADGPAHAAITVQARRALDRLRSSPDVGISLR